MYRASILFICVLLALPAPASAVGRDPREVAFAMDSRIYVMQSDGSGVRMIYGGRKRGDSPEWSPRGTRLVFACSGGHAEFRPRRDICTIRPDGGSIKRLTNNNVAESDPTWSPDGRKIAYVRQACRDCPYEIWVMDRDGSDKHPIATPPDSLSPDWHPDGTSIAYSRDCDIEVYDLATKERRNLTAYHAGMLDDPCERGPAWSPDGEVIAYSCGSDTEPYCGDGRNVWTMDADGRDAYQVTRDSEGGGDDPTWLPGGSWICYLGGNHDELYTVLQDGTGPRRLTRLNGTPVSCTWRRTTAG